MSQQQPQTPPNQPMPDHRLNEIQEKMRQLELQNTQLRTTVDFLKQGGQPPQQERSPQFKPEVEEALKGFVKSQVDPIHVQYRQQIGYLADQLDQAKFQMNYGGEKYKAYMDKVENIRQQEIAQGKYVPREDILRMVYFEEAKSKAMTPDPAPQAEKKEPVFDPFFQTYVDPVTKMPIQPGQQLEQEAAPQTTPQMPQQMQTVQQVQPTQVQPGALPPQQTNHPFGNAYGQNFGLPGQGLNSPNNPAPQANPRAPLDLATISEADLEAFEKNFGEIPL